MSNDANRPSNGQLCCEDKKKCLERLQLILDGQASEEETLDYETHVIHCTQCSDKYFLEKCIKEHIQNHHDEEKKPCPSCLVDSIKEKLSIHL